MSDDIVVPGTGIKSCYVGMRVNELPGEWISGDPNSYARDYLFGPALGIVLVQHNAKVYTVSFEFSSKLFDEIKAPYRGKTEKGISSDSSIENVIYAYGQPTSIYAVSAIHDVGLAVDLIYLELGIKFKFSANVLESIITFPPQQDYDPRMAEDIGDTTQYRAIGSDRSQ